MFDADGNPATPDVPIPTDARGLDRVAGAHVDIGAFEQQDGQTFKVTTLDDELDSNDPNASLGDFGGAGDLSLREALVLAQQDPRSHDTITFDATLINHSGPGHDGTLVLVNGELLVDGDVTIDGDINGDKVPDITIDADRSSGAFAIYSGTSTLNGLTITGGFALAGGGVSIGTYGAGGYAIADVTISNSVVHDNTAIAGGGIIVNLQSTLHLSNTDVSHNHGYVGGGVTNGGYLTAINSSIHDNDDVVVPGASSGGIGGGLYNYGAATLINTAISGNAGYYGGGAFNSGQLALINTTIANNTAAYGGGLYNAACGCGDVTLTNSTLSGNYAFYDGGGIYNAAGTVNVVNSIVAGNAADYTAIQTSDITGAGLTTYAGTNLFTSDGVANIFASVTTVTTSGGQSFQAGALANNGGPIETIAIKRDGPAHNHGDNGALPPDTGDLDGDGNTLETLPVDARGLPRVDHGIVDVGAFEYQSAIKGDFDGDRFGDLFLFQDGGSSALWSMHENTRVGDGANLPNNGPTWHAKAFADLDHSGDGFSDIVWQNDNGAVAVWQMQGATIVGDANLPNPGATTHVVGAHDFDGNGGADILLQGDDGHLALWLMQDATHIGSMMTIGQNPGAPWHAVAGDFNGDGKAGLVFTAANGGTAIWEDFVATGGGQGGEFNQQGNLQDNGPTWHVKATGDFDGDRKDDIVWQNDSGQVSIWLMNGLQIKDGRTIIGTDANGPTWHVVAARDMNADGRADLVFQNDSGAAAVWENFTPASGTTATFNTQMNLAPDPNPTGHLDWHIL